MFNAFLKWDGFIFPKVVKFIYYIGLTMITIGTVIGALVALGAGINAGEFLVGLFGLIMAFIGGLAGLLVWRIMVELWTVLFSIHDLLREIRDQGAQKQGAGPAL